MSRAYRQRGGHYKAGRIVRLFAGATFGASGAVSAYNVDGGGTIVDTGTTGKYIITLADKYPSLKLVTFNQKDAGDLLLWVTEAEDVDGAKTISISCKDDASALLDPTSGHVLTMEIVLEELASG